MDTANILQVAKLLENARLHGKEIAPLTQSYPELDLAHAYKAQWLGITLRGSRGEKIVGYKMGFTSKAKMEQMGLHSPIYGYLLDSMQVPNGGQFSLAGSIHPKMEPEIAFFTKKDLRGKVSVEEAMDACEYVTTAIEILDSRFTGFKYFSLPDVVADNCSSSAFVLGETKRGPRDLDFTRLKMELELDGKVVHTADSSAILGNPFLSLVELCSLLASHDLSLPAGSIVLAGAATQAVSVVDGSRVRAVVEGFEPVSVLAKGK